LIEVTVMLVVIVLFAALIVPHVVNMVSAQKRRESYGDVLDLAKQARDGAVESGLTYALTYDPAKSEFDLKKEPAPQDANTIAGTLPTPAARPLANVQSVSDLEQVSNYDLPSQVQASKFVAIDDAVDGASWIVHFYPDGTSDGGGVELSEGGTTTQSIQVDKSGISTLVDGSLPDSTEQLWQAGTYAAQS
jgi:type II secretory pathway pseudopilin PulG